MIDLIVKNANLFQISDKYKRPKIGPESMDLSFIKKAAMVIKNGIILDVGKTDKILRKYEKRDVETILDVEGKAILPGFVDPHTHAVFIGTREAEFKMRLEGKAYLDILQAGGGILSTTKKIRDVTFLELVESLKKRIDIFYEWGTTTIETKSGYGLSPDAEIKQLEAIKKINEEGYGELVPTFLGAHAIPIEYKNNKKDYIDIIVNEMIPKIAERKLAYFIDVFCEKGVYTPDETVLILKKGIEYGLRAKIHADEIEAIGCTELAGEINVTSCDHLLKITESGMNALKKGDTIAVLLPGTAFSLKEKMAPARSIIEHGIPIAIATDCNPGSSYTESIPFIITLSVLEMGLSPEEAITASTLNAAYAIGMGDKIGSLDPGKQADFIILNEDSYLFIPYHYGVNPIFATYKKGKRVKSVATTIN